MVSRATVKVRSRKKVALERATLSTRQVLTLDSELCIGCGICERICPEKAVTKSSATVNEGKLAKKCQIDIDAGKCHFCGECVVLCPLNAIKIEIDGKERIPVIESEAFPKIIKDISVDINLCNPVCKLACQEICPTKAVKVITDSEGPIENRKIVNVQVYKQLCIFCKKCEVACPLGAINVVKPINGIIKVNTSLCPEKCQACVDVCPSKCISLDKEGKPFVDEEFCIYCGACQEVCPQKAIALERTRILHSEIKSGAWNEALEKLTSYKTLVKELSVKCRKKVCTRASAVEASIVSATK
ncbi:MAG: 4Fe-4S binding protein [Candidatus Bathyarchaeia archaeon]